MQTTLSNAHFPCGEAELPLRWENPGEYLEALKQAWIYGIDQPSLLRTPYRTSHPLAEALCHILAKRARVQLPPFSQPEPCLPFAQMIQFALLRKDEALAQSLFALRKFPSLWCPGKDFKTQEVNLSLALLLRSFGQETSDLPLTPYFAALAHHSPNWKVGQFAKVLPVNLCDSIALATKGEGIPLGALSVGNVHIPAFGPHAYPLNNQALFGIRRTIADTGWAESFGHPEVWFETKIAEGCLHTKWQGITAEKKIAFVFFIQADQAYVGEEIFAPQTLPRYLGPSRPIIFAKGGTKLCMEGHLTGKMELIPLAGQEHFWNAQFLLSFDIFTSQAFFSNQEFWASIG